MLPMRGKVRPVGRRHPGFGEPGGDELDEPVRRAGERDDGAVVCGLECVVAPQHVCCLANCQPEVRPFQRDLRQLEQATSGAQAGAGGLDAERSGRRRDASAQSPYQLNQLDLQIDRRRQLQPRCEARAPSDRAVRALGCTGASATRIASLPRNDTCRHLIEWRHHKGWRTDRLVGDDGG